MNLLVTGAKGFVGRNLLALLRGRDELRRFAIDIDSPPSEMEEAIRRADIVFHLAGVNRPRTPEEFETGNAGFTQEVCDRLRAHGRTPKIILTSSIQAALDNPYGVSKRKAEEELRRFCDETGAEGIAYRLKNLFGKWCRPNYNSVTATFCHNVARMIPLVISDPAIEIELTHIDDVMEAFLAEIKAPARPGFRFTDPLPSRAIRLGELADTIRSFRESRSTLLSPDFSDPFVKRLYGVYLSYLAADDFGYSLDVKADPRGSLAEFIKFPGFGQIFVSRTEPGVTRGNHFHHTKTEKFLVLEGDAVIRFRALDGREVIEYPVSGRDYRVVDIPTGYTHSIENIGDTELVTLFWACEIFDPTRPDTHAEPVRIEPERSEQ